MLLLLCALEAQASQSIDFAVISSFQSVSVHVAQPVPGVSTLGFNPPVAIYISEFQFRALLSDWVCWWKDRQSGAVIACRNFDCTTTTTANATIPIAPGPDYGWIVGTQLDTGVDVQFTNAFSAFFWVYPLSFQQATVLSFANSTGSVFEVKFEPTNGICVYVWGSSLGVCDPTFMQAINHWTTFGFSLYNGTLNIFGGMNNVSLVVGNMSSVVRTYIGGSIANDCYITALALFNTTKDLAAFNTYGVYVDSTHQDDENWGTFPPALRPLQQSDISALPLPILRKPIVASFNNVSTLDFEFDGTPNIIFALFGLTLADTPNQQYTLSSLNYPTNSTVDGGLDVASVTRQALPLPPDSSLLTMGSLVCENDESFWGALKLPVYSYYPDYDYLGCFEPRTYTTALAMQRAGQAGNDSAWSSAQACMQWATGTPNLYWGFYNGSCYGVTLPNVTYFPLIRVDDSNCNVPCSSNGGAEAELCGGTTYVQLYVTPGYQLVQRCNSRCTVEFNPATLCTAQCSNISQLLAHVIRVNNVPDGDSIEGLLANCYTACAQNATCERGCSISFAVAFDLVICANWDSTVNDTLRVPGLYQGEFGWLNLQNNNSYMRVTYPPLFRQYQFYQPNGALSLIPGIEAYWWVTRPHPMAARCNITLLYKNNGAPLTAVSGGHGSTNCSFPINPSYSNPEVYSEVTALCEFPTSSSVFNLWLDYPPAGLTVWIDSFRFDGPCVDAPDLITSAPTSPPTSSPTSLLTSSPTTGTPTSSPIITPTTSPTISPTYSSTNSPTNSPTSSLTTNSPTRPPGSPTLSPTFVLTSSPTSSPTPSLPIVSGCSSASLLVGDYATCFIAADPLLNDSSVSPSTVLARISDGMLSPPIKFVLSDGTHGEIIQDSSKDLLGAVLVPGDLGSQVTLPHTTLLDTNNVQNSSSTIATLIHCLAFEATSGYVLDTLAGDTLININDTTTPTDSCAVSQVAVSLSCYNASGGKISISDLPPQDPLKVTIPRRALGIDEEVLCTYWNTPTSTLSTYGCYPDPSTPPSSNTTTCLCNHATFFVLKFVPKYNQVTLVDFTLATPVRIRTYPIPLIFTTLVVALMTVVLIFAWKRDARESRPENAEKLRQKWEEDHKKGRNLYREWWITMRQDHLWLAVLMRRSGDGYTSVNRALSLLSVIFASVTANGFFFAANTVIDQRIGGCFFSALFGNLASRPIIWGFRYVAVDHRDQYLKTRVSGAAVPDALISKASRKTKVIVYSLDVLVALAVAADWLLILLLGLRFDSAYGACSTLPKPCFCGSISWNNRGSAYWLGTCLGSFVLDIFIISPLFCLLWAICVRYRASKKARGAGEKAIELPAGALRASVEFPARASLRASVEHGNELAAGGSQRTSSRRVSAEPGVALPAEALLHEPES